ncbi:MAG: hypothetical protein NTV11_20420 [Rhodocyclales bacterium]|nr:hypothetical protein [Rhodocyclales bacterium]
MSDALSFGKHEGKPLADVPLQYLLYLTGRDYLRASRPATTRIVLRELLRRLQTDFEVTLADAIKTLSAEEWRKVKATKAQRKGGKLSALDVTRREEAKARREQAWQTRQAAIEAERRAMAERIAAGTDAAYFVMRTRQGQHGVGDLL